MTTSESSTSVAIKSQTKNSFSFAQPIELRKDGAVSRMRSHKGNIPVLPQTKFCPHCPAKFTRTTHLNRHLRTHTNERLHRCDTCGSQFTRSDLLTRHKRSCGDPHGNSLHSNRTRRKSCKACAESKIKCDLQQPCFKCKSRGKECIFLSGNGSDAAGGNTNGNSPPPGSSKDGSRENSLTADVPKGRGNTPTTIQGVDYGWSTFLTKSNQHSRQSNIQPLPGTTLSAAAESLLNNFTGLDLLGATGSPLPSDSVGSMSEFQSVDAPVHSHLNTLYSSDLFEPFFSSIFSTPATSASSSSDGFLWGEGTGSQADSPQSDDAFPFATQPVDVRPFMASVDDEMMLRALTDPSVFAPVPAVPPPTAAPLPPVAHSSHLSLGSRSNANTTTDTTVGEPAPAELQHYLYLFFTAFLSQMPIIHGPTWTSEGKPAILINAMQACGALFVKTRTAYKFIMKTLDAAREVLVQEFAKNPTDSVDQINLVLAVVLIQTIGLFHQKSNQRASSNVYHTMLVMMIRQAGLIAKNALWVPANLTESSLDLAWQEWGKQEMTKRALLLSYLHDCCHCIYFALPCSYHPAEIELKLPCEEALWRASTATEWFVALRDASPYGPTDSRLTGVSMPRAITLLCEPRLISSPIPLSPFSHFVLIHGILRDLFLKCTEKRLAPADASISADSTLRSGETTEEDIFALQFALHNWLQNWLNAPELPRVSNPNDEPPFIFNALPFYWLGQVSLLAYQEGLPPFEPGSPNNLKVEVRFRLVKQWLKHIRGFLRKNDQAPTLFWGELMKIRLRTLYTEVESSSGDEQEGLLGFFPDH